MPALSSYDYDLIIVGGGLIGASLACAAAGQGLRIALLESQPFATSDHPSYDDRSLALAYGTRRIFAALGIWSELSTTPILNIHISDRGQPGTVRIRHSEQRVEALGYMVEARDLGNRLLQQLAHHRDVDIFCPAHLETVTLHPDAARLTLQWQDRRINLTARLLAAADGAQSQVRNQLGIDILQKDYRQSAVIANLTPQLAHNNTAYERFTGTGPLALLPLSDNRCALVYTIRAQDVDAVLALDDKAFLGQVRQHFGDRLGRLVKAGRRSAYPLQLIKACEHFRPRLALIGNAAHTLHPIAGQGFNLGIRDVAVLAEIISDAHKQQGDIGSHLSLQRYADWRRQDQQRTLLFTDSLVHMFSNSWLPVKLARNCGLALFDLLPPAKQFLARQMMGMSGQLPRLARGLTLTGKES
jgi:2-octaprenyl-6-methoxyphenol hydroxylase